MGIAYGFAVSEAYFFTSWDVFESCGYETLPLLVIGPSGFLRVSVVQHVSKGHEAAYLLFASKFEAEGPGIGECYRFTKFFELKLFKIRNRLRNCLVGFLNLFFAIFDHFL